MNGKINFGTYLKGLDNFYGETLNVDINEKMEWYLNELKDLRKHLNKEIKNIKKCLGE